MDTATRIQILRQSGHSAQDVAAILGVDYAEVKQYAADPTDVPALGGGGGGGAVLTKAWKPGRFYGPDFVTFGSGSMSTDNAQYVPFWAPAGAKIDRIAAECVSVGGASPTRQFGIYRANAVGEPGPRLWSGPLGVALAVGMMADALAFTFPADDWYYTGLTVHNSGVTTFRGGTAVRGPVGGVSESNGASSPMSCYAQTGFYNELEDPALFSLNVFAAAVHVWMRAAA
jgi:hypothetical protein